MSHRDAIIAYCPPQQPDAPTVDLFHVERPEPWALHRALQTVGMSSAGYTLPDLTQIECDNNTKHPTQIDSDVPIDEFGNTIDYITVAEVYLVHPTGLYTFLTSPLTISLAEIYEEAVTVDVWRPGSTFPKDEFDCRITADMFADLRPQTIEYTAIERSHEMILRSGRHYLQEDNQPPNDRYTHSYDPESSSLPKIAVKYNDIDRFSKITTSGLLLALDTPDEHPEDMNAKANTILNKHARARIDKAIQHYRYQNPEYSDAPDPNDERRHEPLPEATQKHMLTEWDLQYRIIHHHGPKLSPLSAYPFGDRLADHLDCTTTHILKDQPSYTR